MLQKWIRGPKPILLKVPNINDIICHFYVGSE